MRAEQMDVGDECALQRWARRRRESDGLNERGQARWERERGFVDGRVDVERAKTRERSWERIDERDLARGGDGNKADVGSRQGQPDVVRADDLGVGHVGALPVEPKREGQPAGDCECGAGGGEPDGTVFWGHAGSERHDKREHGRDGIGERDCVGERHVAGRAHGRGADGRDGVRADELGVGHGSEVRRGAERVWEHADGIKRRRASGQQDERILWKQGDDERCAWRESGSDGLFDCYAAGRRAGSGGD